MPYQQVLIGTCTAVADSGATVPIRILQERWEETVLSGGPPRIAYGPQSLEDARDGSPIQWNSKGRYTLLPQYTPPFEPIGLVCGDPDAP